MNCHIRIVVKVGGSLLNFVIFLFSFIHIDKMKVKYESFSNIRNNFFISCCGLGKKQKEIMSNGRHYTSELPLSIQTQSSLNIYVNVKEDEVLQAV